MKEGERVARENRPKGRKENQMFTVDTTPKTAVSKFDVIKAGKIKESFDTYEAAWAYAKTLRGAMVRYFIKKK